MAPPRGQDSLPRPWPTLRRQAPPGRLTKARRRVRTGWQDRSRGARPGAGASGKGSWGQWRGREQLVLLLAAQKRAREGPCTEAAEEGQVLGCRQSRDDGQQNAAGAEKEHGLAHAPSVPPAILSWQWRPPSLSPWARASGCRPGQLGRHTQQVRARGAHPPTFCALLTFYLYPHTYLRPYPSLT